MSSYTQLLAFPAPPTPPFPQIRPLSELPPDAAPQDFPRPPRGSQRAERAATAHALGLAEAKAGSRWWAHLKGLNNKVRTWAREGRGQGWGA